jgi:hypothetical protein
LAFQVEYLQLKLVLSLFSFHLFGLALVDDLELALHLGLGLSQVLLCLPGMVADHVCLAQ